jgi:hypothetical protein
VHELLGLQLTLRLSRAQDVRSVTKSGDTVTLRLALCTSPLFLLTCDSNLMASKSYPSITLCKVIPSSDRARALFLIDVKVMCAQAARGPNLNAKFRLMERLA